MIKIKNIVKVLLIAMFICVCSIDCSYAAQQSGSAPSKVSTSNTTQDASFCGSGTGVFSELVRTGQNIFQRLRDLIYVVAGFGIIGVAVGGFFGNLNWKWLGAIVISLIVIASAGELIILITGCESFGKDLITDTLTSPTTTAKAVK